MADGILFDFKIDKGAVQRELNSMRDDIKGFSERIKSDTALNLSVKVWELKTALDDARKTLAQAKKSGDFDLQVKVNADISILQNQLTQAQRELRNFARTGEKDVSVLGKNFASVWSSFQWFLEKTAGLAVISYWLQQIWSSAITLAGNLEQAKISFTTMLGSAEEANILLAKLSDFAKKTPFELVGIRQNAKQLLAMGIESKDLIPTLKSLGDVSAGLSVPLERLALAYGQVIAKGKLQGGELKQFTEAGVPILAELANMLGKTRWEIQDLITKGAIGSDLVVQAFKRMSWEWGKFANLMDAQSKTFQGTVSNLKDSVNSLWEAVGTVFLPLLTKLVSVVNSAISPLVQRIQENKKISAVIFGVVWVMGTLIAVFASLGVVLPAVTAGMTALWISVSALFGPIGIAISLVTALYVAYKENFWGMQDIVNRWLKNLQVFVWTVKVIFGRIWSVVSPPLKAFYTLVKNTVWSVITAFDGLIWILEPIKRAMRAALATVSFGMSEVVNSVYKNLWKLDFIVSAKREAIGKINQQAIAEQAKNNPSVASYNPNLSNLDFKAIKLVTPKSIDLPDLPPIPGSGGWGWGANEALKEQEKLLEAEKKLVADATKQASDIAIDAYNKIGDRIEKSKDQLTKYWEEVKKVWEKFMELQKDATKSLQDITSSLLWLEADKVNTLGNRYVEIGKQLVDLQQKLTNSDIKPEDQKQIEEDVLRLTEEKYLIESQTTKEQRKQAEEYAKLSETQKQLKKYEEEKLVLLEKQRIVQNLQKSTFDEQGRAIVSGISDFKINDDLSATYKDALGNVVQITDIKNAQFLQDQLQRQNALQEELLSIKTKEDAEIISQQNLTDQRKKLEEEYKQVFNASIESQKRSVKSLFDAWADGTNKARQNVGSLVLAMQEAIRLQQQVSASTPWFASWGFTGMGAKYDVAGVVHKWEYVVPQWMVNRFSGIVWQLESIRTRGFADWGFTSNNTTNKNFNANITANSEFDINRVIDYFKRKA